MAETPTANSGIGSNNITVGSNSHIHPSIHELLRDKLNETHFGTLFKKLKKLGMKKRKVQGKTKFVIPKKAVTGILDEQGMQGLEEIATLMYFNRFGSAEPSMITTPVDVIVEKDNDLDKKVLGLADREYESNGKYFELLIFILDPYVIPGYIYHNIVKSEENIPDITEGNFQHFFDAFLKARAFHDAIEAGVGHTGAYDSSKFVNATYAVYQRTETFYRGKLESFFKHVVEALRRRDKTIPNPSCLRDLCNHMMVELQGPGRYIDEACSLYNKLHNTDATTAIADKTKKLLES